jgi:serine protease inhibitor
MCHLWLTAHLPVMLCSFRVPMALLLTAWAIPMESQSSPALRTDLPRARSPGEVRLVDGANAFTFELLRQATRTLPADSNPFLSPLSAAMALGMALNGANGETFAAMQKSLRLGGMTEGEINQAYRDLIKLFTSLDSTTAMRIANSMWAREGLPLEPTFQKTGRTFFDAEVRTLDFGSPAAVKAINEWVSDKTNRRIPRLLNEISPDEMLFLINAIYFKGKWRNAFDPKQTQTGPFYGADGRSRSAKLMRQEASLRYHETAQYQAVDLLYGNGAFAMTVLLPTAGKGPGDLLASLTPDAWKALTERFSEADVNLTLPRFRLEYARRLNDDLTALGMEIAFDGERADFSRIANVRPNLHLSRVEQKTFVEVNEEGTEAAAATSVGVAVAMARRVFEMRVDRPFLFAIRERLSGTVLFLGVMNALGD